MPEQKYWITPKGEIIKISKYGIYEHFMFFSDCDAGREMKILFNISVEVKPENLFHVLNKGFIRVLELYEILNISYAGHSMGNQTPVSLEACNSLFTFLLKPSISEVQYDCFIGSKCHSAILPKKEFVRFFKNIINFDQKIIARILNDD